ncbi:MAG TPA: crotonase/enoyl-CoA hydratase family protein [Pseudolabrys sp.]|nr:crotonase/enoyl-CoA hydratase family protein [Pseudolabrys sp.]
MLPILITDDGPIRTIRMNRPEKKNALTLAMYDAMAEAIEKAQANGAVRCLMIAGAPGAFCAGNDLNDFVAMAQGGGLGAPILRFLHALARNDKPLVAAVSGVAVGVGTTMLLHCDQVFAADDARLSTPFVSLGLVPEAGSSLLAPRLMGHARAFSLLVMGKPLSAGEAMQAGIVNAVVPAAELEQAALAAARAIAALPAEGIAITRRLMRGSVEEIIARIDEEAALFKGRLASPEAHAAFAAFFNRKP